MAPSPTLIIFAIQSAIRLGHASRQAYVDSTRRREITLPLPNFNREPNIQGMIEDYFRYEITDSTPVRLRTLVEKLKNTGNLSAEEKAEMHVYYLEWRMLMFSDDAEPKRLPDGSIVSRDILELLTSIRQWGREEDPTVSTLQRVGGTLLEVGVDYFANVPGGLNVESQSGKALHALFEGFDDVKFSEEKLGDLPQKLFFAVLDVIAQSPDMASDDPNVQQLIKLAAKGLTTDVAKRLEELQQAHEAGHGRSALEMDREKTRVTDWAELVFRSVLKSAGEAVVKQPALYLGVREGAESSFVGDISETILKIVLDAPHGELDHVFTKDSIESIVKAATAAVAKYPELVTGGNDRLGALVGQVAGELNQLDDIVSRSLFPETVRIVLEKTSRNLDLAWPHDGADPAQRILTIAAKDLLSRLTKKPEEGQWRVEFTRDDILGMLDAALDEVASNPQWITQNLENGNAFLTGAIDSMLGALRSNGDNRLSGDTASLIVQSGLKAISLRLELLDEVQPGEKIIASVLNAVVSNVLSEDRGSKAAWRLAKSEVLGQLTVIALDKISSAKVDSTTASLLDTVVRKQISNINEGEPWSFDTFASDLEDALAPPTTGA